MEALIGGLKSLRNLAVSTGLTVLTSDQNIAKYADVKPLGDQPDGRPSATLKLA